MISMKNLLTALQQEEAGEQGACTVKLSIQ
jgi:hypothetical protein